MIKFALVCDRGHGFESWFPSGQDYETQVRRGFVDCPSCGSTKIEKAIMAPAIARRDRDPLTIPAPVTAPVPGGSSLRPAPSHADMQQPLMLLDDSMRHLQAMVRELRAKIVASTTDVGANFPEEARRMHEGDIPEAPIRGQATPAQLEALVEEGISVLPLPVLPDDLN